MLTNKENILRGYMDERVAIFIDGSNLYHSVQNNFGRHDLNFTEFANKLVAGRKLFRIYYYNMLQDPAQYPDSYREQQDFLEALKKTPYLEIRLGTAKKALGTEKGIDIMIGTDLLYFAWSNFYDVAILVSGDADFAYAVQAVKNMGKHVEVAYFESGISKDLLDVADNRYLLDRNFFNGVWVVNKRRPQYRRTSRKGRGMPGQGTGQGQTGPAAGGFKAPPPSSSSDLSSQ
jgi:uncharacterized LabA/DUF88 family protein